MAVALVLAFIYFFLLCQKTNAQSSYIIKYDLPQARINVGEECAMQMDAFVGALTNFDTWAITMLDASSKIPSGILNGNVYDLGSFHECLGIEHQTGNITIKGKHCMGALNIGISLSLCIPDACKPTEVSEYLNISSSLFNDDQCQTYEPTSLDASDIVVVTFFSIILYLMVTSTVYDVYLYKTQQTSVHPILLAFSVFTNGRKLLTVNTDDKRQLSSLHGLRCISIMWVVIGHRYIIYAGLPSMNMTEVLEWPTRLYTQYVQAAYLAVDTFFFITGMLISYGFFSKKVKAKIVSFVPLYYLHRYLRLTPAAAALMVFTMTIWRYFGTGPYWPAIASSNRDACLNWWWSFLLYVQNYVNYTEMCIVATWYLSADMQMFLLSPFILFPLEYIMVRFSKKVVYGACASLVLFIMLIQIVVKLNADYRNENMTHERLAVWMVGLTTGIFLQHVKEEKIQIKLNRFLNLLIWAVVLVGMVSIVLTMHDVKLNPEILQRDMYDTFHRPAWGLGLAWIVYSCMIGYGGIINWFLSLPAFQVLSRLTYSMYLIHFFVIFYNMGRVSSPFYFSDYNAFYVFCGDIIFTTAIALIWVLAFESPVIVIEKCIFGPRAGSKKKKEEKYPIEEKADRTVEDSKSVPIEEKADRTVEDSKSVPNV